MIITSEESRNFFDLSLDIFIVKIIFYRLISACYYAFLYHLLFYWSRFTKQLFCFSNSCFFIGTNGFYFETFEIKLSISVNIWRKLCNRSNIFLWKVKFMIGCTQIVLLRKFATPNILQKFVLCYLIKMNVTRNCYCTFPASFRPKFFFNITLFSSGEENIFVSIWIIWTFINVYQFVYII